MSSNLDSINSEFEEQFHLTLERPELIQSFLKARSKEFDRVIIKEFKRLSLESDFAIIALGGYGRNELFPGSDLDLSIIQLVKKSQKIEGVKDFIAWLWTLNVKVGHSVRTLREIHKITKVDLKEFTSHLSHRIIYCQPEVEKELQNNFQKIVKGWNKSKFFKAKKIEQFERFQSFDSTEFSLEPDLKESPGCLRDFQTALWVLEHCFEVKNFKATEGLDIFDKQYLKSIDESYCYIKSMRFALNLNANSNRISFENQLLLASKAQLKASKKSSAVEKFMCMFFQHASKLSDFNEMVFQAYSDRDALIKRPYTKNFYLFKDRLGIQKHINLAKRPGLILESFLQIGRLKNVNGLDCISMQRIRRALPTIDPQYFLTLSTGHQFLEILRSQNSLSAILKKLKQLGILRLLIPEFGEVEGQMQFDMFHVYTVDEHTLKVVRNMRQMQIGNIDAAMKIERELINKLPKIELLYLAGIFHDLGKGKGGDHSEIGAKIVTKFCKRLELPMHEIELLQWLVKNHLVMSSISQKTDIHDPETIEQFTKTVDSLEKLNYIYILTINDIRGTNPTLWNSWKHDLLKQLFLSSRKRLNREEHESDSFVVAERKRRALNDFNDQDTAAIKNIWMQLPSTYFAKYQIEQLAYQAQVISREGAGSVHVNKRQNFLEVFIFTPNQLGLFYKTAQALEGLSLETIDANIHTTNDGQFAMNTFICRHKVLGSNLTKRDKLGIQQKIKSRLSDEGIIKIQAPKYAKKVFTYSTRVEISKNTHSSTNLITLETLDQPSLLSKVANIFFDHGINVISSRITTLGEKVEDNFIVVDANNGSQISQNKERIVSAKLKNL